MFENNDDRKGHIEYFLPKVKIRDYNVTTDRRNFFDHPVKSGDMRRYDNSQKITNGQGDDYTTGCLLDFPHYRQHYKMISIDLSKQKPLDVGPKAVEYSKLVLQEI